jgi:hypothetical protein
MTTVATSEILNRAADLIEERGWAGREVDAHEAWGEYGGPMCIEGGIMAAAGLRYNWEAPDCPAYKAVLHYLQGDNRWGMFRDRLYSWNDVSTRTADEVIEVLRAVAVIEAAREDERAEVPA